MRVRFRFSYSAQFHNGTREAVERVIRKPLDLGEDGRIKGYPTFDADLRELLRVVPADSVQIEEVSTGGLADLIEAIERLESRIATAQPAMNERVQVVVPGFALMQVSEVLVRTDYCTDMLQEDLNEGWKILAICPQPDQRRPDYIIGRTKEEL